MAKRKRDPTFTAGEKMALIELVEERFSIVENKKTDQISVKIKNEEWQKIAEDFNAHSSVHMRDRAPAVLKNCWENMKKKAKQEQNSRNKHSETNGEPAEKLQEEPAPDRILDLIRSGEIIRAGMSGCINTSDSDETQSLNHTGSNDLSKTTLLRTNTPVDEEQEIQMRILRIQEQKEAELLKQERFKTLQEKVRLEILKMELQKLKE